MSITDDVNMEMSPDQRVEHQEASGEPDVTGRRETMESRGSVGDSGTRDVRPVQATNGAKSEMGRELRDNIQ